MMSYFASNTSHMLIRFNKYGISKMYLRVSILEINQVVQYKMYGWSRLVFHIQLVKW